MKIKKICEYLSDIGLLQMTDINRFLTIYSQIDQNKCKKETDRLKISLFSYINTMSKDDNQLFNMCRNIIDSFLNNQIVLKFRTLNILCNILKNKINLRYNTFFYKLKINILSKRKNKIIVQPIYNNKKLSILDNNDFQINNEKKRNKFNFDSFKFVFFKLKIILKIESPLMKLRNVLLLLLLMNINHINLNKMMKKLNHIHIILLLLI